MKYNLIFYLSRKTSYCEKALKKALAPIGGEAHLITSATTPVELGAQVSRSLKLCPLTVIIGGFDSFEDDNLRVVLSRVFSNSALTLDNMRKLSAESGSEGYIIRDKNQILLSFPDSPEDITEMCGEELLEYIDSKLNVVKGEE
ncbi:hypothetical protein [Ruminococcus sp.]|uniref:hypothetical protein n=1 Tax=Ruminococcus sp. TaxID=41978 RepID=UPI002E7FFC00|nr:hypothetical protein [Ruminococcus sp.]MEE3492608.1 hypothetical protein [Ruminococcus sp.]